jgi:hypothetical protein
MIQPAVYRIVSARRDFDRVISLENDNPRGNLVVEKLDESADRQKVRFSLLFPCSINLLVPACSGL